MRTASWMRVVHSEGQLHRAASIPPAKRNTSHVWDKIEDNLKAEATKRWPGRKATLNRATGIITIA